MQYDLEQRALDFSKEIYAYCKGVKQDTTNRPIISQVMRSAGSIGANYIEANDSLGKKDFAHRLRIARKEAKETIYWLKIFESDSENSSCKQLIQEATELRNILSAIIKKTL